MYVAEVPNRTSPPAFLLRESFRANGKVRNRTLANISSWPRCRIDALRRLLRGEFDHASEPEQESPDRARRGAAGPDARSEDEQYFVVSRRRATPQTVPPRKPGDGRGFLLRLSDLVGWKHFMRRAGTPSPILQVNGDSRRRG